MLKIYHISYACYVIVTPSKKVFIYDPGMWGGINNPEQRGVEGVIENVLSELGVSYVEAIIISHFHNDHFEGVPPLLEYLDGAVGGVYSSGIYSSGTGGGRSSDLVAETAFLDAISQYNVPHIAVSKDYVWNDPDVSIECIRPNADEVGDMGTRTNSPGGYDGVVVKFTYGDFSLLLVGDRTPVLFYPLNDKPLGATILQWHHHGDTTDIMGHQFLEDVNPSLIVGDVGYYLDGWTPATTHKWFLDQNIKPWIRQTINARDSRYLEGNRGPLYIEAFPDGSYNAKRSHVFRNRGGVFG